MKLTWRSSALVVCSVNVWLFSTKSPAELADANIAIIVLELFSVLACWLVIVPHNISSALMIRQNVFLAWDAIECVFVLVYWFNRKLSCPRFLIIAVIWLFLRLLWIWRPLLVIFCPRVIRWFWGRGRQNNMLRRHFVFALWSTRLVHLACIAKDQKTAYNSL